MNPESPAERAKPHLSLAADGDLSPAAGAKLLRSEQIAGLLDDVEDAVYALDARWRFTYVNRAAARLWRRDASDLLGRGIWESFPEMLGTEPFKRCQTTAQTGLAARFEAVCPVAGRRLAYVIRGDAEGVFVACRDVEDERRADDALRRYQKTIGRLFDASLVGIALVDDERVIDANDAYLRIVGLTREELAAGQARWADMTPPEHLARDRRAFAELEALGEAAPYERDFLRPDGARVPVIIGAAAVSRTPPIWAVFAFDISARKDAEKSLRTALSRLETALEAAQLGTWELDLRANVVTESARLREMLGIGSRQASEPWASFIGRAHPDDRALLEDALRPAPAGRPAELRPMVEATARFMHPDGTARWHRLSGAVVRDERGAPASILGVAADVAAQVAGDLELRLAKEAAADAAREKSRALAAVAHDLKQPLQIVRMSLSKLQGLLDAENARVVARAERAAVTMGDAFDKLIEMAQIDAGVLAPRIRAVSLDPILREIDDQCGVAARAKGLAFTTTPTLERVRTDPVLLKAALLNLAWNAVAYTDSGEVRVVCAEAGDALVIRVEDTGIGIDPGQTGTIFEEFRRLDSSRRDGVGLGLAICKRVADALGHKLSVLSTPGSGSTFSIELPIARDAD